MPLAPLPTSTIKLIGSSQVITSVSSVIKELMENSLDSGAQHIEIKLDKHGLEKIEVKDDGCGIGKNDVTVMCLPNYTSKILDFSDLDSLSSYGFRGEALSSLCNIAKVNVTTKTAEDEVATSYTYDHNGQVICSKISHVSKGTIVTVTDLFKNLPVRKQYVSSSKKAAEELKRVEKVVKSLGMVHPRLRVTLIHNKFLIWQKTSVGSLRQSVMQVVNLSIVKQLHHILHSSDQIRVEMLVPKRDCDVSSLCFSNFTDAYFLFINSRPLRSKEVEKAVYNKLFEYFGVYVPSNKYPVCITSLTLPPNCLDVNLEPNKTRVYLKNQDEVLDFVHQCMHLYYGEKKKEEEENPLSTKPVKKRKTDEEYPVDKKKLNIEEIKTNVVIDDCQLLGMDKKYPDEAVHLELSQSSSETVTCLNKEKESNNYSWNNNTHEIPVESSSETVTCSGESTSKQDSDTPNKDSDYMFEQFCLNKEKESNNYTWNNNTHAIPVESSSETVTCSGESTSKQDSDTPDKDSDYMFEQFCLNEEKEFNNCLKNNSTLEIPDNVELNTDSESPSSQHYSIFFPLSNNKRFISEEASSNDRNVMDIHVNQQRNCNQQILSDLEFKGCMSTSSKKPTECLKITNDTPSIVTKNESKNGFLPKIIQSFSLENEGHCNYYEQKSSTKCEENQETEVVANNIQEPSSPTLSQWSKGVVVNNSGVQIQGPSLLARQPGPESPSTSQELSNHSLSSKSCSTGPSLLARQPGPESPSASQELSNRSVSSQMGCKEMSAFTKFARKMRKEILEEKPDLSFTKVAQMLQVHWRHLDIDEKKKYEETVKIKKSPTSAQPSKQKPITAFMNSTPNIEVDISMESIRQMMAKESLPDAEEDVRLVGQLEASPLWVYSNSRCGVFSLSVSRLLEAVRYHQHIAEFSLPSKLLDKSFTITPSGFSVEEWELLLSLERSPNGIIKDKRFTDNGFVLEIVEGELEVHVSYVPQNVAYSGTEEVLEILNMLLTHGLDASLAQCRPLKIASFIRSEVMRVCSKEGLPSQPQQVSKLLSYWLNSVVPQTQDCIHHNPVTQCLHSF